LLSVGEIFALVVYAQLILENAKIYQLQEGLVDQIFDVLVRDFSRYALQIYSKPSSSAKQMELCLQMIRRPEGDAARYQKIWQEEVAALDGLYEMKA
jgi:acyl-CoA dehydrogenase